MSKVFRFHNVKGGGSGWFTSNRITREQLNEIKTDGKEVATSIPSPFARIDLVKSAFRWVSENGIKGSTSYHKLVSDALDIAQLFYSVNRYSDDVKIVSWNPGEQLDLLINGNDEQHKEFAETLKLFWDQDSSVRDGRGTLYNFEKVNRLYFLLNTQNNHVIGGTSPATLFFASPDVNKVTENLNIVIGDDTLFDDEFMPLHKREKSFILYLYALSKQNDFPKFFPEVFNYLETIRNDFITDVALQRQISELDSTTLNNYPVCSVLNNVDDPCEVLGITLRLQNETKNDIAEDSDFTIKSDFETKHLPLILPNSQFSKDWTYTTRGITWNANIKVPYRNIENPNNSILPQQNEKYFWLSIGNFLQDKIIKLPYEINEQKFETCNSSKYLLPLTNTFYEYFKVENTSKYLQMKELAGGAVKAILEIPVKASKITFEKLYSPAENNINEIDMQFAILPFVKSSSTNIKYTFGLINDIIDRDNANFSLTCINKGVEDKVTDPVVRDKGKKSNHQSQYFKYQQQFELIKFIDNDNDVEGFIRPLLYEHLGQEKIKYAIDFGTTNTHIEYKRGNNATKVLDSNFEFTFLQSLLKRKDSDPLVVNIEETFEKEMIPFSFSNKGDKARYPTRTALVYNKNINYQSNIELFCHINNYLFMENISIANTHLNLATQLKWSNYSETDKQKQVESFIEYMLSLVYYKTLVSGGDLKKIKIIWFYPVSMSESELGTLKRCWYSAFNKVFNELDPDKILIVIPESVAPHLHYKSSMYGDSLSIDIGGGSSDIAIFDEHDIVPKLISSFKFAGNAIFGDGYPKGANRNNTDRNGFVNKFSKIALDFLKSDSHNEDEKNVMIDILNNRKDSADFSSFLFALENNDNTQFNYSNLISKDRDLKVTLLIFYAAIAYYTANLLKKSDIEVPKNILISGTASKTSSILDPTNELKHISDLFTFIFEEVYNQKLNNKLKFQISDIPKEITCKGAIKADINESIKGIPIKFWIGGKSNDQWSSAITKDDCKLKTPTYGDLADNGTKLIIASLKEFYLILDKFVNNYDLESKFMMNQIAYDTIFKNLREDSIEDYLIKGIRSFHKEDTENISESLFFYPLIGILNELAYKLSEDGQ